MKRLYAIGPVTGIEDENLVAFETVRRSINAVGYEVAIPHDFIERGTPHDRAMLLSIRALTSCTYGLRLRPYYNGVVLLKGWENSPGALVEKQVAEACGIPCKTVEEWLREVE